MKDTRVTARVTEREKQRIAALAKKCGLPQTEYIRQRALGFEPRSVPPDAFFVFCEKLDAFMDKQASPEVTAAALEFLSEMEKTLIAPRKEDISGPPQSKLLCGEKEHPRSGEPFAACGESDERSVM